MKAILAVSDNWAIGLNGGIPWPKIKEDFLWFKEFTMGKTVVFGRKTFETMPPLPGRNIIVLSRKSEIQIPNNAIICGGGEIYREFIPKCDEVYVTYVQGEYEADTFIEWLPEEIVKFSKHKLIKEFEQGRHCVIKYEK